MKIDNSRAAALDAVDVLISKQISQLQLQTHIRKAGGRLWRICKDQTVYCVTHPAPIDIEISDWRRPDALITGEVTVEQFANEVVAQICRVDAYATEWAQTQRTFVVEAAGFCHRLGRLGAPANFVGIEPGEASLGDTFAHISFLVQLRLLGDNGKLDTFVFNEHDPKGWAEYLDEKIWPEQIDAKQLIPS